MHKNIVENVSPGTNAAVIFCGSHRMRGNKRATINNAINKLVSTINFMIPKLNGCASHDLL